MHKGIFESDSKFIKERIQINKTTKVFYDMYYITAYKTDITIIGMVQNIKKTASYEFEK